ncbi:hypothetical protein FORC53_2023 [Vibrio vulnificus]|uniref:Uncharacterized protein n=1 Tax=Vibrio vulnificus TaxID=672 RepID=A0AAN1PPF5_VIBVL|nr:hypothetical protein FORC53_2023 [Vibrio vulnificus]
MDKYSQRTKPKKWILQIFWKWHGRHASRVRFKSSKAHDIGGRNDAAQLRGASFYHMDLV